MHALIGYIAEQERPQDPNDHSTAVFNSVECNKCCTDANSQLKREPNTWNTTNHNCS